MIRLARVRRWWMAAPPLALDGLIAIALTALALTQAAPSADHRLPLAVCVMTLSLLGRRRWPFATFALVGAGLAWALWLGSPWPNGLAALAIAVLILATYSMSTHTGAWPLSLGLTIAAVVLSGPWQGPVPVSGRLLPVLILGSAWLVGFVLRRRQLHVALWQGRVARLEREQEHARAAALAAERARIARELHDVVSHSVSVMVIQAGAARQVLARDPIRAAGVLGTVEAAGREALGELRRLLGVLSDEHEAPRAPQPGMAGLGGLIERVREAGLPVTLRVEGVARALPAGLI
jgi:signal transduction histidine kinase